MKNFSEIYKEEGEKVYRYLYSYTKDLDLAEELTQETFLRAFKSIHRYDGSCKLSVWLCQIAKHILYQEFRKRKRIKEVQIKNYTDENFNDTEKLMITLENKRDIYKAIQILDTPTKDVVYLRLTGELSFKEIGEILNRSENWARVTYYRGKSKIARRIRDAEKNIL